MEFYQKNPSALASLRGNIYEEKIIDLIKSKAKYTNKEITKSEAEKILKNSHNYDHDHDHPHDHSKDEKTDTHKLKKSKKPKSTVKKKKK